VGINNYGHDIFIDSDDDYIFTGSQGPNGGYSKVLVVKTDSSGEEIWNKTYGGSGNDAGYSIHPAGSGYIVAGVTSSYGAGGNDVYLLNIKSDGDTLWTRTFGGAGGDEGRSVKTTSDGGYVILGTTNSHGSTPSFYLIKTDGDGLVE
jgi:hypothetical protein